MPIHDTHDTTQLEAIDIQGDVAAALDASREHVREFTDHDPTTVTAPLIVGRRDDHKVDVLDLERFLTAPARPRGTTRALTGDGFITAFAQRTGHPDAEGAAIYADPDHCTLLAILNDDAANPGWRDHRITYAPKLTPEWEHWIGHEGGLVSQEQFAAVIEEGQTEIREPSATVMLDIAQTFRASTEAKFKQAGRLRDGRTQFVYEEEVAASAGSGDGEVKIPETFTIEVRPFYGAQPVLVTCELKYRLKQGDLTIGYRIHRPNEIKRASFREDVLGHVRSELPSFPVLEAVPDGPVQPGR